MAEAAASRRRPGRRWQRPVANILPQKRSTGRRPTRAGRTRSPSSNARRAGWVGCNFALNRIPADARIPVVTTILSPSPPSPTGERARGEVARLIKTPRPNPLPAQSRGEGNVFRTIIVPPEEVRAQFKRVKPLKDISVTQRGWTLDVLNGVRSLGKKEFNNTDAYTLAGQLEKLHPDNRHVRDKIRQQLQVLRDAKLLLHVSSGVWRLP